jgi:hypothetical protein
MEVAGNSTADGGNVQQWADNGGNNQKWKIDDMGGGYYRLTAKVSGKAADVANSSTADGANMKGVFLLCIRYIKGYIVFYFEDDIILSGNGAIIILS